MKGGAVESRPFDACKKCGVKCPFLAVIFIGPTTGTDSV